ncbi:protein kinase [Gemmata sp. JC717]|uniref:serine/threonine protein kinase n=1 Tax=Gemmata algarum TaxID=2975278 RepID=UPI0021BB576D|nr:serine/threonine protein kinase [Gemmata algarum]MDY3555349.1 protein kinase [Gemmata algarum]
MAAIAPISVADLLALVRKSGILSPARVAELPSPDALPTDPQSAAAVLVQRGLLTQFQSSQLLAGRHKGFRIGPYVILDLLGRGGMGAVYLADRHELRRKAAIKILAPVKGEGAQLSVERFLREGRAAGALDHPNIVRVFDVLNYQNTYCLVMEHVDGETLQQYVDREGAMPVALAAECVAQAAAGLQHAHERGFIHRDIKPGNLIRNREGVVKVLDMGLARSGDEQDKLTELLDRGAVVGTADFIAPEQAINSPHTDGRADIYSLGATLYTLLAGRPPFDGNTTQKLMQHQLRAAAPLATLRPDLPPQLTAVVARMLAKKPADRYQSGVEVVAALAPWTENSERVAAALSHTYQGKSAPVLARVSPSSAVLGAAGGGDPASSNIVDDPSGAAEGTVELSAGDTMRERPAPARAPGKSKPRRRRLAVAALVAGLLVAAGVAVWLGTGGEKPSDRATRSPAPASEVTPNVPPAPQPRPESATPPRTSPPIVKTTPPVAGTEQLRAALNPADLKPFVERVGLKVDPVDPNKKAPFLVARSGDGTLPPDWSARCWNKDSEMELFTTVHDARPAIGLRTASGPGSAMLFSARFGAPSAVVRLKLEYAAAVREKAVAIKFKPDDARPAWEVVRPAVGTGWRTEERLIDLRGASGGLLEFHNSDPAGTLYLGSITVAEPNPTETGHEWVNWSADLLPGFDMTKRGHITTAGTDPDLKLKGVTLGAWKPDTVSAWRGGTIAGARTIGFTNLSEPVSAQIAFRLEEKDEMGLAFARGEHLRLEVTYRTTGTGHGAAYFQNIDDRKWIGRTLLPNSNGSWKTVEVVVTRGTSPLRCQVDALAVGAENRLHIRSVKLTGFAPPNN